MTRKRWIQDPVTHKLIPVDEYTPAAPSGPFVMADVKPYQSMVTGEMIGGRRQHREHLRQHGLIEMGNDAPKRSLQAIDTTEQVRQAAHDAYKRFNH